MTYTVKIQMSELDTLTPFGAVELLLKKLREAPLHYVYEVFDEQVGREYLVDLDDGGRADSVTDPARQPQIGEAWVILPGAESSSAERWPTPPAGTVVTIGEEPDSEGDIYVTTAPTADPKDGRLRHRWWVQRDGIIPA